MKKINCFGDFCPLPLLKAKQESKNLDVGESFMLVTDHSCVMEGLIEYFQRFSFDLSIDEVLNGVWEITITKK